MGEDVGRQRREQGVDQRRRGDPGPASASSTPTCIGPRAVCARARSGVRRSPRPARDGRGALAARPSRGRRRRGAQRAGRPARAAAARAGAAPAGRARARRAARGRSRRRPGSGDRASALPTPAAAAICSIVTSRPSLPRTAASAAASTRARLRAASARSASSRRAAAVPRAHRSLNRTRVRLCYAELDATSVYKDAAMERSPIPFLLARRQPARASRRPRTCSSAQRWAARSAPRRCSSGSAPRCCWRSPPLAGALGAFGAARRRRAVASDRRPRQRLYITAGILLFPRLGALVASGCSSPARCSPRCCSTASAGSASSTSRSASPASPARPRSCRRLADRARAAGAASSSGPPHRMAGSPSALLAGAALPVQGAINAQLAPTSTQPSPSARSRFWSRRPRWRSPCSRPCRAGRRARASTPLRAVPWWGWLGGLFGATYVTSVFLLIPEIGAAPRRAHRRRPAARLRRSSTATGCCACRAADLRRRLAGVAVLLAGRAPITLA